MQGLLASGKCIYSFWYLALILFHGALQALSPAFLGKVERESNTHEGEGQQLQDDWKMVKSATNPNLSCEEVAELRRRCRRALNRRGYQQRTRTLSTSYATSCRSNAFTRSFQACELSQSLVHHLRS